MSQSTLGQPRGRLLVAEDSTRTLVLDKVPGMTASEAAATVTKVGAVQLMPAHRDNSPRNWIVDDRDAVSLIDFGSADYEPWWVDIYRLSHAEWWSRPALLDAFLAGYGRDIDDETALLVHAYGARMSVSTIVWATDHGDAPFVEQGYVQLRRVLEDP